MFVGAIVMLPLILVRQVFGTSGYGRKYAMVNVVIYIFAGLTLWFVGLLRDQSTDCTITLCMLLRWKRLRFCLLLERCAISSQDD